MIQELKQDHIVFFNKDGKSGYAVFVKQQFGAEDANYIRFYVNPPSNTRLEEVHTVLDKFFNSIYSKSSANIDGFKIKFLHKSDLSLADLSRFTDVSVEDFVINTMKGKDKILPRDPNLSYENPLDIIEYKDNNFSGRFVALIEEKPLICVFNFPVDETNSKDADIVKLLNMKSGDRIASGIFCNEIKNSMAKQGIVGRLMHKDESIPEGAQFEIFN